MAPYQPAYSPQPTYAGFWIRVVAYVIDWVINIGIGVGIGVFLGILAVGANPSNPRAGADALRVVNYAIGALVSAAYFAGLWTLMGATLGQRALNLRVVDAGTGQPIAFGRALLRWVGLIISFLCCLIGVIWVAFDPRKQGWMDKIAGTVVVQG